MFGGLGVFCGLVAEHLAGTNAGGANEGEAEELPSSVPMVKCRANVELELGRVVLDFESVFLRFSIICLLVNGGRSWSQSWSLTVMIGVFLSLAPPCFSLSAIVPKNFAARDGLEAISAVFCIFFSLDFSCFVGVSLLSFSF